MAAGAALLTVPAGAGAAAAAAGLVVAVTLVALRGLDGYPHHRLGACNLVTLLRAGAAGVMTVALTAPEVVVPPMTGWALTALALASLSLDGVDGWLARRSGLASAFGARFDMEVDALFALVLALGLLATGKAGVWVLALGVMRYLFVAAAAVLPWLAAPLPDRLSRKTVCVVQIAALILMTAPPVAPPLSVAIGAAATAALVWSFAVDVVWLWRRR